MSAQPRSIMPQLGYGPYGNADHAAICIQRFINDGFSPSMAQGLGIIWAEPGGAAMLRPPMLDREDQLGPSLLVQWHGSVVPSQPKLPPGTVWQSVEDAVRGVYEKIGAGIHAASRSLDQTQQMMQQSFGNNPTPEQMDAEGGVYALMGLREAWRWAEKELAAHPKTAAVAATVLDAVGVVAGIVGAVALFPEVAGVASFAAVVSVGTAAVASGALLAADGGDAYYLAVKDDEAAAIKWDASPFVRRTQLIAPLLVLPDAVRGGVGVAREIGEAGDEVRAAKAGVAQAAVRTDQAAVRVADQQAANTAKAKVYKGDRQKLQKLVAAQKNAVKRLGKANKLLVEAQDELRNALIKSSWPDMPALLSTAGGTGVYVGNLPGLVHRSAEQKAKHADKRAPIDHLMPSQSGAIRGSMPHFISCSIVVSSALQNPGRK
ncbi:MAG: hypothetical protein KGK02_06310 [Rhodospirillales bacterium]|nr:hypothetical protein [Rhodospirillales bacterium]